MSEILGISKKTLVQIEKGRNTASWTTIVAVCALFNHSRVLLSVLGDDPVEFVKLVGLRSGGNQKIKTFGGKVWWKEVKIVGTFKIQQNLISHHYRIIDEENYRYIYTFDLAIAEKRLQELNEM